MTVATATLTDASRPPKTDNTVCTIETAKNSGYDVEAAWEARDARKSNAMSLNKCLTQAHAASFVIGTVLRHLLAILHGQNTEKQGL